MIGKNRFRLVAEAHEQVDVPGSAQHGAGKELMGIGRNPFDFAYQRFSYPCPWWAGFTDNSRIMHTPATVQKRTDPTITPSVSATKICFSLASSLRLSRVSVVHPLTV